MTKLWIFNTLTTPTLLLRAPIWGLVLLQHRHTIGEFYDDSQLMERLIVMIFRLIQSKSSVAHAIVQVELGAAPLVTEAIFEAMTYMHGLWESPWHRYVRIVV